MTQEVKTSDSVKLHFTIKTSDGNVLFSSYEENNPLEIEVGQGTLPQKLEENIVGMQVNETKSVDLSSEEAYGDYRDELVQEINKEKLPEDYEPEVGGELYLQQPEGEQIPVRITNVMDNSIVVDANHPLAGKDLQFEVQPVEIVDKESQQET